MLSSFPDLHKWLSQRIQSPAKQSALLRQITDRIRNSLELKVVLQTAVDEVTVLLQLDRCFFFWYFKDLERIQVVCESANQAQTSYLGHYPLSFFGAAASLIELGELVVTIGNAPTSTKCNILSNWFSSSQQHQLQSNTPLLGATASLLVPVKGDDSSIGFIACLADSSRRWSTTEVEFMQWIAQQLEIAIRQAQLYERTQKQARREQLVNQITTQTRQSLDLKTILTQAIAQLLKALEVDRCLVHLVEDLDDDLDPISLLEAAETSSTGFRRKHLFEVCRPPFPPSIDDFDAHGPITEWVICHRQQVVIADIAQDDRIGANNEEYQLAQIKSSLVVPVQADGKLLAILYLNQCSGIRYWSRDDQKLAQAVANQLAISIQQGHLYAQTRQQAIGNASQARYLAETLQNLRQTQTQLIQSEKLSSLGQLVAGIAHEINNPISFIYGNIPYVEDYFQDLMRLVTAYQAHVSPSDEAIHSLVQEIDLEFMLQDLPSILRSMQSGAERIREIVQSLREFSHLDEANFKVTNVHQGLDNTLFVLQNQIKPDIEVIRCYGDLPEIECYPRLLNQVFMNLLINAIEALNNSDNFPKTITITTTTVQQDLTGEEWVRITIADNGCGIPHSIQSKIFDPFFTTKPVGQGIGLGLAASYQTVVHHHRGRLSCSSEPQSGSEFTMEIPVQYAGDRSNLCMVPLSVTTPSASVPLSVAIPDMMANMTESPSRF